MQLTRNKSWVDRVTASKNLDTMRTNQVDKVVIYDNQGAWQPDFIHSSLGGTSQACEKSPHRPTRRLHYEYITIAVCIILQRYKYNI